MSDDGTSHRVVMTPPDARAVDDDDVPRPPSVESLGSEVSLEQCERLFTCLHFHACEAMCRDVYAAYAIDPSAPRPLVRGRDDVNAGARARASETTSRDETDDDDARRRRAKAAARRLRRPEDYLDEIYDECSCSEDEDENSERNVLRREMDAELRAMRWPPEDLSSRDACWIASCLWVQCKFKSARGLGRTIAEDEDDIARGVPRAKRAFGPTFRMLWCKLKWEEGPAKNANAAEELEIERVILELFDEARRLNVVESDAVPSDKREAWMQALGNLSWLYASQILASQRDAADAAMRWIDDQSDLLDSQIMMEVKSWIRDVGINRLYRFTYTVDDMGRAVVVNERVDDVDSAREPEPPTITSRRSVPLDDRDNDENKEKSTEVTPSATDAKSPTAREKNDRRPSLADELARSVGEIARDPLGDHALRAYATAAVGAYTAYILARAFRSRSKSR